MKALGQILLYLAATVLLGALLAAPLYWLVHAAAPHLPSARLATFLLAADIQSYFDRAILIAAFVLLWPLARALEIRDFGTGLGLQKDPHGWAHLAAGFVVALALFAVLGFGLIRTGEYKLHSHMEYARLAWLPVTGFIVAIIEEFLFRGALQGAIRKSAHPVIALVSVAFIFAAVHFLKKPVHGGIQPAIHWWTGFALLPDRFSQFSQPALLAFQFSTLFSLGIVLGIARDRTRSLWLPVGLHAGIAMGKLGFDDMTHHENVSSWLGTDLQTGVGPLYTLFLILSIVWLITRKSGARVRFPK